MDEGITGNKKEGEVWMQLWATSPGTVQDHEQPYM